MALERILEFKSLIQKEINDNRNINGEELLNYLKKIQRAFNISFENNLDYSYYIHAVIISIYLESRGYDLKFWNDYIKNLANEVSKILSMNKIPSNKEGEVLELFVLHNINNVFDFGQNQFEIRAYRANSDSNPTYLLDDSHEKEALSEEENLRIIGNISTVMKIRGQERKEIWGDNDVVVLLRNEGVLHQFCIISCKTSLRERVYQSVFWSLHSRLQGVGRHVFVTVDKGANGKSEIGNRKIDNSARKSRDVLESTMDRVYVLRNSNEVNRSSVIKDFVHLKLDLELWAKDISGKI